MEDILWAQDFQRRQNLRFWIENYKNCQKEINQKLNKLSRLINKDHDIDSEEANKIKEEIFFLNNRQEIPVDEINVGTDNYTGLGLFFNLEYKHLLRENTTRKQLKKIHDAFLKAGLRLDGESAEHKKIINKILKL